MLWGKQKSQECIHKIHTEIISFREQRLETDDVEEGASLKITGINFKIKRV